MALNYRNQEVLIVGGGLAGLVASLLLVQKGFPVTLVEKKTYPFHRVCGEYVSNEVMGFLKRNELYPLGIDLPQIRKFEFSDTQGKSITMPLDLGGFGISRYVFDEWLYRLAIRQGVEVITGVQVSDLYFDAQEDLFRVSLSDFQERQAYYVLGAFGKRSKLDQVMGRKFFGQRSPYIGVKYHIRTSWSRETVALHNFNGGYCGINAIEEEKFNLCYLGSREQLREYGSIEEMEKQILWKNPLLESIFRESEFLFDKPEVINEINFERKLPVENHLLMLGDAAGLITPLCGNGMAMAMHSAKLCTEVLALGGTRQEVELRYTSLWNAQFYQRLGIGRAIQGLFGSGRGSIIARNLITHLPPVARFLLKNTHGQSF
ncbi:MAG: NAD(P)/FAD-dependent oxidoreductase [Algoriphagus sp.]